MPGMRSSKFSCLLLGAWVAGSLAGCGGQSTIKPAELLDETTGMTVGALQAPIEFVEDAKIGSGGPDRRATFAYLGPVEWDTSGELTYGLWIHVAPGNDQPVAPIDASGAVSLLLDDTAVPLYPMKAPRTGSNPYKPIASWGQTAYFHFDVPLLKRLAASQKVLLQIHGIDADVTVKFLPTQDVRDTLLRFEQARGITGD